MKIISTDLSGEWCYDEYHIYTLQSAPLTLGGELLSTEEMEKSENMWLTSLWTLVNEKMKVKTKD